MLKPAVERSIEFILLILFFDSNAFLIETLKF